MRSRSFSTLADAIAAWWTGLFWTSHSDSAASVARAAGRARSTSPDDAARPPRPAHLPDGRVDRRRARRASGPGEAVRAWLRGGPRD